MRLCIALSALLCYAAILPGAIAGPIEDLQAKQRELASLNSKEDKATISYQTTTIELENARSTLESLHHKVKIERKTLDDLIDGESKFPNMDFTSRINEQRKNWRTANKEYLTNKQYVRSLEEKARSDKQQLDIVTKQKATLQRSIDRISDQVAGRELESEISRISTPRNITVTATETCSLTITKDACLDKARIRAERDASERGSIVVVESVTEMKNFTMSKDEARSRVQARLSDIRIIKQSYDLTPDKTGWRVEYAISALVTPVITDQMRQELKQQIIAGLAPGRSSTSGFKSTDTYPAGIGSSQTPPPAAARPVDTRQLEAQSQRELENLRDQAEDIAEEKESDEAKRELRSRNRPIMVF